MQTACITGITGQTGSYLCDLLLSKCYKVYGMKRRSSSLNTERIDHVYVDPHHAHNLEMIYGDLTDYSSLSSWIGDIKPDLFFNMAAQSHVRVSFDIPEYTMDVTGTGVTRVLEAIRKNSPKTKFLTASSSEMFGSSPPPQNEQTPFHPRSPYGVAKVAGFFATVNYREAYGLHACNAISFNHECLSSNTPIIVRINGMVDVVSAKELIPLRRKGTNVQTFDMKRIEIWDGKDWTSLKTITATKYKGGKDQKLISVQARAGIVEATSHHNMLDQDMQEKRADNFVSGDRLAISKNFPPIENWTVISEEMAEFLGFLVSEGHISDHKIQFTNNDETMNKRVSELWSKLFMGETYAWLGKSGFNPEKSVGQMNLNGCPTAIKWLHSQIYNSDGLKKVPPLVLNSTLSAQKAFLKGYYAGDGLKAGNGESIKTNSSFLAQGLCWIYFNMGNYCSTHVEHRNNEHAYYQLNVLTDSKIGQHLRKEPSEVRKIEDAIVFDDWVFDVETGSSVLMAGVGRAIIHNSPRRGETFVTRKITRAATRIKLGLQDKLYLGNLSAQRDWSHAKDVAEAMYKIVTAPVADDFVIASGEMHSVEEFARLVFSKLDLDYSQYVEFDPRYLRPSEVDALCGDPTKLRTTLGWNPEYRFVDLVDEMIAFDMELARKEKLIKDNP